MNNELVKVDSLKKYFPLKSGLIGKNKKIVKAVDNVSFSIIKGETFGLVGESGCGKSTTGKMLLHLLEPTSGKIFFKGEEITTKSGKELLTVRRNLQMIFQNPYGSFDPKMTLKTILEEPLKIHGINKSSREKRIKELLNYISFSSSYLDRYSGEFSGGQLQRIAIARSLALNPQFIVADEPVSALDVSIQAQILNLLIDLQKDLDLTYLFISHDLSVVQYVSDRVGVMYLGRMVELADCESLYNNPLHPYTKLLLSSVPIADPERASQRKEVEINEGSHKRTNNGCRFCSQCNEKLAICEEEAPELIEYSNGHFISCHLYNKEHI